MAYPLIRKTRNGLAQRAKGGTTTKNTSKRRKTTTPPRHKELFDNASREVNDKRT